MVAGIFYEGSGLGDQLFRFITSKTIADEKGFLHGMVNWPNFKGESFMKLPMEYSMNLDANNWQYYNEKEIRDITGVDTRSFDPESQFIEDDTIIDGYFEDSKYWGHNLDNINKWLAVEPLNVPDDVCIIGFRGGEYATQPDLFLGREYYMEAIEELLSKNNPIMEFQVHTDDPKLAQEIFKGLPNLEIIENTPISHSKHSNMGFNWRSARYAKYAIIPNSAFFILPRLLKHFEDPTAVTIAPRYWARRNKKAWARPACYYQPFTYI